MESSVAAVVDVGGAAGAVVSGGEPPALTRLGSRAFIEVHGDTVREGIALVTSRGEARAAAAAAAAAAASPSMSSGGGCCLWPVHGGSPGSVAVRVGVGEGGWLGVGLDGGCGGRAAGVGSLRGGVLGDGGGGGAGAGAELLLLLLLLLLAVVVLLVVLLPPVLRLLLLPVLLPLPRREGLARGVGEVGEGEDGGERAPGLRVAAAAGAAATVAPDMSVATVAPYNAGWEGTK